MGEIDAISNSRFEGEICRHYGVKFLAAIVVVGGKCGNIVCFDVLRSSVVWKIQVSVGTKVVVFFCELFD